jgi:hypothetical protein
MIAVRIVLFRALGALAALLMVASAQSATVTLNGSSIKYVYDDVVNAAALALFGTPTINGDVVRFLPPSFKAESIDGIGTITGTNTDLVSGNFIFDRVYSTNQKALTQIQIVEFGDYEITNGDDVSADLLFTMSNNNNFLEFTSDSQAFDAAGDSGGLQTWQLVSLLSPEGEFSAVANDVAITIQNTLTATTNANGETAWIQKKISLVATTGTLVPVPPAVWLFGSALGLLGWMRLKAH